MLSRMAWARVWQRGPSRTNVTVIERVNEINSRVAVDFLRRHWKSPAPVCRPLVGEMSRLDESETILSRCLCHSLEGTLLLQLFEKAALET